MAKGKGNEKGNAKIMPSAGENPESLKKALNYKNPGEFGRMNIV